MIQINFLLMFHYNTMSFLKEIKRFVIKGDFFSSSEILRYNGETSYKTVTGAIISISVFLAIAMAFSSMIISTMNRTTINSSLEVKRPHNPPEVQLNSQDNKFMFSISLEDYNTRLPLQLAQWPYIFSISFLMVDVASFFPQFVLLQPCTKQHWKMIPEVQESFDRLLIGKRLCPPLGINMPVGGFSSSQTYKFGLVEVHACVNSTFNYFSCASQTDIDAAFANNANFYFKIAFTNPIINPNQPDYIDYYLENRNYMLFSKNGGSQINIEFSDYTIESDNSILPFESITKESGYIVEDKATILSYAVGPTNALGSIIMSKSPNSLSYKRKVLKVEEVISYIGGLLGAVTACLFIFKLYTEVSLELNIGLDLFKQLSKEKVQNAEPDKKTLQFNILTFVSLYWYKFLKLFKKGADHKQSQKMQKYQKEIDKQLDIKILLERLMKLESCMKYIFDDQDIEGIRNLHEITYERARQLRTFLHGKPKDEQEEQQKQQIQNQVPNIKPQEESGNNLKKDDLIKGQDELGFPVLKTQANNNSATIPVQFIIKQSQLDQQNMMNHEILPKRQPKKCKADGLTYKMKAKRLQSLRNNALHNDLKQKIWADMKEEVKKQFKSFNNQQQMADNLLESVKSSQINEK